MAQASDESIEQRPLILGAFGATLVDEPAYDLFPLIPIKDQLIFEKVDPRPLIFAFPQVVAVVVDGNLGRRVFPGLVCVVGYSVFIYVIEMLCSGAEKIAGT